METQKMIKKLYLLLTAVLIGCWNPVKYQDQESQLLDVEVWELSLSKEEILKSKDSLFLLEIPETSFDVESFIVSANSAYKRISKLDLIVKKESNWYVETYVAEYDYVTKYIIKYKIVTN